MERQRRRVFTAASWAWATVVLGLLIGVLGNVLTDAAANGQPPQWGNFAAFFRQNAYWLAPVLATLAIVTFAAWLLGARAARRALWAALGGAARVGLNQSPSETHRVRSVAHGVLIGALV